MNERVQLSDIRQMALLVPSIAGYQPGEDQVALLGINMRRGEVVSGVAHPDVGDDVARDAGAHAPAVVKSFREAGRDDAILVIGYGPGGYERADAWADAIRRSAEDRTHIGALVVDGDTIAQHDLIAGWLPPERVQDINAELVFAGREPSPQQSHDDWLRQFDPDPVPSWSPLPTAERAELMSMSPQARAQAVRGLVDDLAAGKQDDPARATLAAHLEVAAIFRDVAIVHAAGRHDASKALLDAFRTAPAEHQSVLAAAAGGTHVISGREVTGALRMLDHVGDNNQNTNVRNLLRDLASSGVSPAESTALIEGMKESNEARLADRQEMWKASQMRRASFPLEATPNAEAPQQDAPPHTRQALPSRDLER